MDFTQSDELLEIRRVAREFAEVVCGLLRSAGIDGGHRVTRRRIPRSTEAQPMAPREILVLETELEVARAVLADAQH